MMAQRFSHSVTGFVVLLVLLFLFSATVSRLLAGGLSSQVKTNGAYQGVDEKKEHSKHQQHHDDASHAVHRHHFALFSGATSNVDQNHTNFTLGLEYEHRLSVWRNRIGIGLVAEKVFADHSESLLAGNALVHFGNGFKVLLASGIVFAEEVHHVEAGHGETGHGETVESETAKEFLFRTGVAKDFHVGKLSLTPTLCFDIISGTAVLVYGLSIGKGF